MKSLTRVIGEGTIFFTLKNWLMKFVGLANVFLILRYLSVYEYGLNELVLSIIPLFSLFMLPGLNATVIADLGIEKSKGNFAQMKAMLRSYFWLRVCLSLIVWIIVFIGASLISSFFHKDIILMIKIVSFSFLVSPIRDLFAIIFTLNLNFLQQALLSLFGELGKLFLLVALVFYADFGLDGVVAAAVFADLIAILVLLVSFIKSYNTIFHNIKAISLPFFYWLKSHSLWGISSNYLSNFGGNINIWLIKFFLGTEAVALFSLASGLISHTVSLLALGDVVSPILSQFVEQKDKFLKLINKSIKYQFLFYSVLLVVAFVVFPPVIVWLFPKYQSAIFLFRIMLFSLLVIGFANVFTSIFFIKKAQKSFFYATLYKYIFMIACSFILIPYLGIVGVGLVYVLTVFFFVLERYRIIKKILPEFTLSIKSLLSFDELDKMLFDKFFGRMKRLFEKN